MKQYVVFFMVCVVIMAERPKTKEQMKKLFKDCKEKTNPSKDDLETLKSNKPTLTTQGGCFMGCLFEGWGLIDETGAFSQAIADDIDTMMSKHPKAKSENFEENLEMAKQVNAKCASIISPNKDACVTGPTIIKCLIEENKPRWFDVQG